MAYRGLWAANTNFAVDDVVRDTGFNFFETYQAHNSAQANRPEIGVFAGGGGGTDDDDSDLNTAGVQAIVGAMFDGQDVDHDGIEAEFNADEGHVELSATRSINFDDIHEAMLAHLEGRPPGQYYVIINKESAA